MSHWRDLNFWMGLRLRRTRLTPPILRVMTVRASFLPLFVSWLALAAGLRAETLHVQQDAAAVVIRTGSQTEAMRYVLQKPADSPLASESVGYFHPLTSPSGAVLTDVGPDDHRHHRGVFLAWVEMHGAGGVDADFWGWGEHAPVKDRKIVHRAVKGSASAAREGIPAAGFSVSNEWIAEDKVLLNEELHAEFVLREGLHILHLGYTLTPRTDLTLSRWAFSGFCVRTRKEDVEVFDPNGPVKLPAPQHTKPETDWPDRPWYAFTLKVADGKRAGVAVLNHPSNPPTLWHNVTGIGMLNPCIVAPAEVKLAAGKPLVLKYRVVTFDGDVPAAKLDELARER